jgi:anthranilate phosphoribosyltransferase
VLKDLIRKIPSSSLSRDEVAASVLQLVDEAVSLETKAEFLCALSARGETVEEVSAFAHELRDRSVKPAIPESIRMHEILDVVGTGGDRLSTFNISTCVALLSSAAGVYVAKHGNRASTSPVGSADVAEAVGLPFDLSPEGAVACLQKHRFCYFFAPRYHPAFKHIVPARKLCAQRGSSTVFNFLGPLLNPGRPSAMLLGAPRPDMCEPLARVLQTMGVRRAMVVCGAVTDEAGHTRYLDEISPLGPTTVAEFYQENGLNCSMIDPGQFPLNPATLADLRGGDRNVNAELIQRILAKNENGPRRDAVLINASAALFVAGAARNLAEGWELASATLESGRAREKLQDLIREGSSPRA